MDRLVLWDVDRTLVAVGIGREIYAAAFSAVTGRALEVLPDFGGRMDRDLAHETLTAHGVPVTEELLTAFFQAMVAGYRTRAAEVRSRGRALAGARAALEALAGLGAVQTVVTGNIRPVAVAKLTAFDLHEPIDFEVGGYGSEDRVRATLVRRAHQRAQDKYGRRITADRVVVIGDTRHDIEAAQAVGVRSIGVATGGTTAGELAAAGADLVLADLARTAAVLDFIG